MGGDVSKGIDTAMAIVTGVITGDITGSLAGASAPWIAEQIKLHTGHPDEKGNWVTDDIAGNLIAHAILGAVVAELQGGPSIAGGVGAVAGELAAKLIREQLYGKDVKDLTEAEKQNISALAQLAAGLAIAAGGGDTGAAGAAIAAGKNTVENNLLSPADVAEADKKYAACNGDRKCQMQVVKETNELDKEKIRALQEYKNQLLEEYAERYREIIADCEGYTTCQLERRDWLQEEIDNRYRDFYNIVTDGASPDDLSFGYYPDDTKIQSLWEGMKNAPGKLVDNIVEGGDKAIRYIDDNSLGKIADDAWEFGKKIASIPREWLNKEIPADSFETALTNLASMTGHDVGEASFYTVAGTATAALGGKIIQWIDGKWTPVKIGSLETGKGPTANKPLDKTDLELQHGKGNVEQGGGNYKETKDKILDNQAANQKANESSKFGEHVAKEQQINAGKGTTSAQGLVGKDFENYLNQTLGG